MKRRLSGDFSMSSADEENRHPGLGLDRDSTSYQELKSERRKVRKVLVERKRRERIDKCLDQLKQYLQETHTGDQQLNLVKADILELTVDHLRMLRSRGHAQRTEGYRTCAREVNTFLLNTMLDDQIRQNLMLFITSRQASLLTSEEPPNKENDAPLVRPHLPSSLSTAGSDTNNNTANSRLAPGGVLTNSNRARSDEVFRFGARGHSTPAYQYYQNTGHVSESKRFRSGLDYSHLNKTPATGQKWSPCVPNDYTHLSMCNSIYDSLTPPPTASRQPAGTHCLQGQPKIRSVIQRSRSMGTPDGVQSSDIDTTSTNASLDDASMLSCSNVDVSRKSAWESSQEASKTSDRSSESYSCNLKVKDEPVSYEEDNGSMWRPWRNKN